MVGMVVPKRKLGGCGPSSTSSLSSMWLGFGGAWELEDWDVEEVEGGGRKGGRCSSIDLLLSMGSRSWRGSLKWRGTGGRSG